MSEQSLELAAGVCKPLPGDKAGCGVRALVGLGFSFLL